MAWQGNAFKGVIGLTTDESTPDWQLPPRPAAGSPNIIYIVLDDVGFAHLGCYGSDIQTPHIDRLAANGLRYTNFHTTGLCSPTRSCLLTGRNHHTNGQGLIAEMAIGFPGYNAIIPKSCGFLSEILLEQGYLNLAIGKWHLVPGEEMTMAGPFDRWPLRRGFDRFYGFLGAEANQYAPDLVYDNHFIEAPKSAEEGYHLTEDLSDRAISFIHDLRSADPSRPFFMYFCPGACHAPHQAPREFIDRYRGQFDGGWDRWREATHQRQLEMGIIPPGTDLSSRPDWVKPWDSLSADEKRLFARMMECFAGFLTHTDAEIGRLVAALDSLGELENTMIVLVSDNGTSGEGGFIGSFNENVFFNNVPESLELNLQHYEDLGGPNAYNHFPTGWTMAGNTPFKRWKRNTHNGGIADPCIVQWLNGIGTRGAVRHHYIHAIDIMPTMLDILNLPMPTMLNGVPQEAIAGVTIRPTFDNPQATNPRITQYYEICGCRAIYHNGWKACAFHPMQGAPADGLGEPNRPFSEDVWELYHVAEDFSECHDLATVHPEKLQDLIYLWFAEAGKYGVLPLNRRPQATGRPRPQGDQATVTYYPNTARIDNLAAIDIKNRSFTVVAEATIPPTGCEGVLIAQGGKFGGWTLFVKDNYLHYEHNFIGMAHYRIVADVPLPTGEVQLAFRFTKTGDFEGKGQLLINDQVVGEGDILQTVPYTWSLTGEGLCCGYDSETAVSDLYQPPFPFTGDLDRVTVFVEGFPLSDPGKAVELGFLRQ